FIPSDIKTPQAASVMITDGITQTMITNERRAFKRVNNRFNVTFKPLDDPGTNAGSSFTKNISIGGVYFTSLKKFDIGQLVDCRIGVPGAAKEGKWTGRVVRCEDLEDHVVDTYGIAVEFVKSFGNAEKDLKKALEKDL
ncbi:MAG: PilZ domain-containing protein, partial [Candidatus Omnitrophota bacterium]